MGNPLDGKGLKTLLECFFSMFRRILNFETIDNFAKAIAFPFCQFCPWWKSCHFSNIRCLWEPFFAHNTLKTLLENFFRMFKKILNLDPKWQFCKGYSLCIVANFGHDGKVATFRILGSFESRFFAQNSFKTLLECFFSMFWRILNFDPNWIFCIAFPLWPTLALMEKLPLFEYYVFCRAVFCTQQLKKRF